MCVCVPFHSSMTHLLGQNKQTKNKQTNKNAPDASSPSGLLPTPLASLPTCSVPAEATAAVKDTDVGRTWQFFGTEKLWPRTTFVNLANLNVEVATWFCAWDGHQPLVAFGWNSPVLTYVHVLHNKSNPYVANVSHKGTTCVKIITPPCQQVHATQTAQSSQAPP